MTSTSSWNRKRTVNPARAAPMSCMATRAMALQRQQQQRQIAGGLPGIVTGIVRTHAALQVLILDVEHHRIEVIVVRPADQVKLDDCAQRLPGTVAVVQVRSDADQVAEPRR